VRNPTHLSRIAAILVIFVALAVPAGSEDTDVAIHIDHVMVGASNLDRAISDFEKATGIHPVFGGKHPGRGTENALVSLGRGTYLELIAPQPDAKPSQFISIVPSWPSSNRGRRLTA
jgi:Glyoxalase-like domain